MANNEVQEKITPTVNHPEKRKGPKPETFRKVKWIRRKRGLIGFFSLLAFVVAVLFFDYYYVLITKALKLPTIDTEKTAGKFFKVDEKERRDIIAKTKQYLGAGQIEPARQTILAYLQREGTAEGHYLAGQVYLKQGDIKSAYYHLKEATRIQKDYYDAQQKLAELSLAIGDYSQARAAASVISGKSGGDQDGLLLEAEIAAAEGKLDDAIRKTQKVVSDNPGAVQAKTTISLALLHLRKGDRAQAEKILRGLDENVLDVAGIIALAQYYQLDGRLDREATLLQKALHRFPDKSELLYYYGLYEFRQGRYQDAAVSFQRMYAAMPYSRIAAYRLGQALIAGDQQKEAKKHIDAALAKDPNNILMLSLKVRNDLQARRYGEVIATLKRTISIVPDAPRPHTLLAEMYWNQGIMTVAEGYAKKAIVLGEQSLSPRIILGDIYYRKGQYGKALEQYSAVLGKDSINFVALVQRAECYIGLADLSRAEAALGEAIRAYPDVKPLQAKLALVKNLKTGPQAVIESARAYYQAFPDDRQALNGYVDALATVRRFDDAIAILSKALQKAPKDATLHFRMGEMRLLKRDIVAARKEFDAAHALSPINLNLLINIAGRYEKFQLNTDADQYYTKALKAFPDNILVVNTVAWFFVDKLRDYPRAKPLINTLEVRGEGAFEKDTVGWYYHKVGEQAKAESYLREALQQDSDNNLIRAHLAVVHFALGNDAQARREANKIMAFLPPGELKNQLASLMGNKSK